jgi:hypothetical protein
MDLSRPHTKRTRYFLNLQPVWESVVRVVLALLAAGHLSDDECRDLVMRPCFPVACGFPCQV